ncbi:MAG: beta-Ala-His dipeptidase [Bacteroidales bacterium]|nr:beta-Ala-His dipeptidase [Bacteroidales bacterium]MCM1148368.1 beta-Ala-His dipeptidase [Bacteroidales bacterium]MCM1207041.1 beta-Ala-His dipeptidase [Bacillota bacterium]MCM1511312.1 beta-Ala-His dipeptidase [Clostridium sp.]
MESYYDIFSTLTTIPRPSHHEEKVADFLCEFAGRHGLQWRRNKENCVVIEKPASPGYEDHEPVVILNHMDMVCVAEEGMNFNPLKDAIIPQTAEIDGERWMYAQGTSLGADNGMGLAMALAILADNSLKHPALEVLTTTNEEDGRSGAASLSPDFIRGRRVLNLDSEAYDEITVGAAGAIIQTAHLPYSKIQKPDGYVTYSVTVKGGRGGHSGVDICRGRANAVKVLANLLLVAIRQCDIKLYLVNFNGGTAAAAIPGNAEAKIVLPKDKASAFETLASQCEDALKRQFGATDTGISVTCGQSVWHSTIVSEEGTHLLLACLNGIPAGAVEMHPEIKGIPLTSNNIGVVRQSATTFDITTHTRSFDDGKMEQLADQIRRIFVISGASVDTVMNAPAWQEDSNGELISLACGTFRDVLGFEPKKVAMHFVLEAGYLVQKFPGIHIASIGPRILEPHSTSERIQLSTADNIWHVVVEMLARM